MALGGDPPTDPDAGAGELLPRRRARASWPGRSAGSRSAWPPTPPATRRPRTWQSDRDFLAAKLRLADFGVTQFFFEAEEYRRPGATTSRRRGVHKPVLPGIMPVTALRSVPRMAQMGAARAGLGRGAPRGGRRNAAATRRCARPGVGHGHRAVRRSCSTPARRAALLHAQPLDATREIYAALGLVGAAPLTAPRRLATWHRRITMGPDGALQVPDEPDHPLHRGRRHRRRHLARRRASSSTPRPPSTARKIAWKEVLAGEKAFKETGDWLPDRDRRGLPGAPHRHQGPAHHPRRRGHPLAQRGAAPDPRPLRVPAPGALVRRASPPRCCTPRRSTW